MTSVRMGCPMAKDVTHWIGLRYLHAGSGEPIAQANYEIHFNDGQRLSGTLDDQGEALHERIDPQRVEKVVYQPRPGDKEPPAPLLELIEQIRQRSGA